MDKKIPHPDLYGLVLIGGKSSRMGTDKSMLQYHKVTQREYSYQLLSKYCSRVFLSCNPTQQDSLALPHIVDTHCEGPMTGILSAHEEYPQASWLVLACDMPYVDIDILNQLLLHRDDSSIATCFYKERIEPLCAIWEASCFPSFKKYHRSGNRSPRRFLEENKIKALFPTESEKKKLRNINEG
ncbi:molybdenum cofactor guanylyltransferase [Fulvivirga sediminis]|uniref:Molybdenum cofactor guanylyltransferase n=1 Tax=Fulvivirga sediminis TaxID=2803949 RepID=A0A937FAU7_9BACT|nr:molybdenum cofactor guanylyltransferase [Fulvivirga sediminis]MBL3657480.1 molybdenum cofactor guanylyltransferase [Fulvivirga sediminis]